jgi:hypothetical protein
MLILDTAANGEKMTFFAGWSNRADPNGGRIKKAQP